MKKLIGIVAILAFSAVVQAHSGGTDSKGCHNDNSPGGYYHCH